MKGISLLYFTSERTTFPQSQHRPLCFFTPAKAMSESLSLKEIRDLSIPETEIAPQEKEMEIGHLWRNCLPLETGGNVCACSG